MEKVLSRGEIYFADLNPVVGSEQGGVRPVLVVQNDIGNRHSNTVIVAAITSKKKPEMPTHLSLAGVKGLYGCSVLLLEQLRTIDKCRLGKQVGRVEYDTMRTIDAVLSLSLGIGHRSNKAMTMTLCETCVQSFQDSECYSLNRIDRNQPIKEPCTVCDVLLGFDFEVVRNN